MKLYGGIDLHSNNSFMTLTDGEDRIVFERQLPNDLGVVLQALKPFKKKVAGIVVESTFNWYWLVDGLMEAGYKMHLANTAAIEQYDGLKHTDDRSDARWLAQMLRLGILPEGYIYPRNERGVRDLLRKRLYLVRQRTSNILSFKSMIARHLGASMGTNYVKRLSEDDAGDLFTDEYVSLAAMSNIAVMQYLGERIKLIEQVVKKRMKLSPEYEQLKTVDGIGEILALTISLENVMKSLKKGMDEASTYCRCVRSVKLSNKKKKGVGNSRNGNKYLAWAFIEAAAFAIRYNELAQKFYQRKSAKTSMVVARKAIANKMARACFYIMRDQVPFDKRRLFAS